MDAGASKIIIGLGGSATNDGGLGLLQALGASFRDAQGRQLGAGGAQLAELEHIDLSNLDARLSQVEIAGAAAGGARRRSLGGRRGVGRR
ncbi:hypothetical protein C9F00_22780, partial [Salmonella enterica subsp. enterica serovar Wilhelmsburg]